MHVAYNYLMRYDYHYMGMSTKTRATKAARARWDNTSAEERSAQMRAVAQHRRSLSVEDHAAIAFVRANIAGLAALLGIDRHDSSITDEHE